MKNREPDSDDKYWEREQKSFEKLCRTALICVAIVVIVCILSACAPKTIACEPVTIYKEVPVPIACTAPFPPLPVWDNEPAVVTARVNAYIMNLLDALRTCKQGGIQ